MNRIRSLARAAVSATTIAGALLAVSSAGASVGPIGGRLIHPRAVGVVYHTYDVTTTADSTLSGSAPDGTCHDTSNYSACSLRAAIEAASIDFDAPDAYWDVINVPAGTYNLESSVGGSLGLEYSGDISIDGAGPAKTIINAAGLDNQIFDFEAEGVNASLSGLTLENGYSAVGGAVLMGEYSYLNVANCAFSSDTASEYGGAIGGAEYGGMSIANSSFSRDTAEYSGGAIYDEGTAPIDLSSDTFSHDTTSYEADEYGGGGVWTESPVSATNVSFQNDTAGFDGGGLWAHGNVSVTGGNFSGDNSADDGGAILSYQDVLIKDVTFHSDDAVSAGGAVAAYDSGEYEGDSFSNDGTNNIGADIATNGSDTVTDSTFSHSTADGSSGVIYGEGALVLTDDTITDAQMLGTDTAGGVIGLGSDEHDDAVLIDDTIDNVSAPSGDGGVVFCGEDDTLTIVGGSYEHASAYAGGAIMAEDACEANIDGATFAHDSSEYGGAIYADDGSDVVGNDLTIDNNASTYYGGGGIFLEDESTLDLTNSTLAFNTADGDDGYGGAIGNDYSSSDDSVVNLSNDTLTGNQADYGGALYGYESQITVSSSTIASNTLPHGYSADYSGGIYLNAATLTLTDSIVSGNTGDQCVGTVYISGGNNLDSDNTCGLYAGGDIINHAALLGPLQNNGGPTETMVPAAKSLALGNGGASCPASDQRGDAVPAGASCSIGAVFVESATAGLKAKLSSVVKGLEQLETFTVTISTKNASPAGTVTVKDGAKTVCTATLGAATKGVATAKCSPGASTMPAGTASLTAVFGGGGTAAPATSTPATKVKVL